MSILNIAEKIEKNVRLDQYTTFKIGGPAKYFIKVSSKEELEQATAWAEAQREKIYLLGNGSNILVNDEGVNGLVIKLTNSEIKLSPHNQEVLEAGAGALLASTVIFAKENNLSGLEWAIGIPGAIGGSVRGNAGAYGSCLADNVAKVEVFDLSDRQFKTFSNEDCDFGYRSSIFKTNSQLIVWQAELQLSHSVAAKIKELMDNYLQQRLKTQPKYPSAGCVFKNLVTAEMATKPIIVQAEAEGRVKGGKLACGYLIDLAQFKGKQIGGALVTPEHGNFIVNYDHATASDVQNLIKEIKKTVQEKFGISLQEELQYFGF